MNIEEIEKIELQRTEKLEPQILQRSEVKKDILHIVYLMVWTKTCGGSKIILEYANRLSQLGHQITIVTYDKKPDWFTLDNKIEFLQISSDEEMQDNIPDCDLVVATSWKNIYSALKSNRAPVVYFEQGGGHIFDVDSLQFQKRKIVEQRIKEVPFIYTVSNYAKKVIKKEYQKDAFVVPNAIDEKIFYPRESIVPSGEKISITTIGPEEFTFKHVDNIIEAISQLRKLYSNIIFNWISQTQPKNYSGNVIVNPPQKEIGDILRNTDIYICASDYEAFGLPVLEAMTCGAAVVTTDNGGISDFVEDEVNGLIVKKNSVNDIIEKVKFLIENEDKRILFAKKGMESAKQFNWDVSVKKLDEYYKDIAQYEIVKNRNREIER